MLLQEKMETTKFSSSEQHVIDFILEKQELLEEYSTTMIAEETYTSPSILVRIAKKLGFHGYLEFKQAFLEEVQYLKMSFQDIDANLPFFANDDLMSIVNKITLLKQESLKDTLSLLHHQSLQKAIRMLQKSDTIKVFTISNLTYLAEEFVHKLRHIGKKAETYSISNAMYQEAVMTSSQDCAICISYSGESLELLKTANVLKSNQVPMIAITSIGENELVKLSDVVLRTTTREKAYSKIAGFSSMESITLLLDLLYACYFQTKYEQHYTFKTELSRKTEERTITNQMIKEE